MVLFINPSEKKFFFKFVHGTQPRDFTANAILDVIECKPVELKAWNYYGYIPVFFANNVGAISPMNGFTRIYYKDRLKLEKELDIQSYIKSYQNDVQK